MIFFRAGKKLKPVGSKSITVNGTHDVTEYETALVNVPGLVPTGTKEITTNGTHDVTNYANASVNVPGIVPSGTKSITTNGTHDVTNYASALVNVPKGLYEGGTVERSYSSKTIHTITTTKSTNTHYIVILIRAYTGVQHFFSFVNNVYQEMFMGGSSEAYLTLDNGVIISYYVHLVKPTDINNDMSVALVDSNGNYVDSSMIVIKVDDN